MKAISSTELRQLYRKFFESKGHKVISSASIIPENDPTVLFTTAGMHPLVPYLMGAKHPAGTRLTDVQKCVRTCDIDDVGDNSHLTFFEMLGNWSLGDYFKKESIAWSWEFLTSPEYLGIDKDRLAFSVFAGDDDCPRDVEAHDLWLSCGAVEDHIFYLPKENNWWGPAGITGPCGPDTEIFIITDKAPCCPDCSPACSCGRYLEIWNNVFMQYNKQQDGSFLPLEKKNVDTGMGLERTVCVINGKKSVYETDAFTGIFAKIADLSSKEYGETPEITKAFRIVADHMRTSTFIMGDDRGVSPSNVDQGYVLRRLIRRATRYAMNLEMDDSFTQEIAKVIIEQYKDAYPELERNSAFVLEQFKLEEARFARTLRQGEKEFEKVVARLEGTEIDGKSAFHLYDTYGYPVEMTEELAKERGLTVDIKGFEENFKQHQENSHAGAEQRFKGGLADHSVQTARLHTATHLLQAALRRVLGDEVHQKGSNITAERLRFDFTFGRKMTPDEVKQVETLVNEYIKNSVPVVCTESTVDEAKAAGAMGLFESKYGEKVKVYTMGEYSKEICGGPHAETTGELGGFKILKEESSSAGVRRIKAVIFPADGE
ncbi:MAG: alanine--tRNA ligase [Eubacteriales bacterium]|nr:alanine--tRNA ligase [Eubacteriales bacterium]MDD3882117.1 alanine--tRNA ligase [Eubacteriales bacterium]MDD4513222.1 alanine--tRNA ligase [Eubacteriales bacterium]